VTENGRPCGDCGVTLGEGADGIQVRSTKPATYGKLNFEIEVPEQFDLDLSSAGGEVRIEGVAGAIKGTTESGALELRRLSGSVDLETKRGDVSLRESFVSGRVHTVGGRVLKGETCEQAAMRKLKEETGLTVDKLEMVGLYEDFFDKNSMNVDTLYHTISVVFRARLDGPQKIQLDSQSRGWKFSKELPPRLVIKPLGPKPR
jgi:8-oxo-dGTP pyrophosphatase MutT (NUDIX family)